MVLRLTKVALTDQRTAFTAPGAEAVLASTSHQGGYSQSEPASQEAATKPGEELPPIPSVCGSHVAVSSSLRHLATKTRTSAAGPSRT